MSKKLIDKIAPICTFKESKASFDDTSWSAELLYKTVNEQKCRAEIYPLKFVNYSDVVWDGNRVADFIYHARRIQHADKTIPIIIGPFGGILDGFHRIAKALLDGDDHIKCYRLDEMPEPDGRGRLDDG